MLQWHSLNMDFKKRVHQMEKYHDGRSGSLGIYVDHSGHDSALCNNRLDLPGDIIQAVV